MPESTVYAMVHVMLADAVPPHISQAVHETRIRNMMDLKTQVRGNERVRVQKLTILILK